MNAAAVGMAGASFVIVMGSLARYLSLIPAGKVPVNPTGFALTLWLGAGTAAGALVWSYLTGSFWLAFVPSMMALFMSSFFLWVLTQRETPVGDIKVKVGDHLLPFESRTSEDVPFHSDELQGKRTLLKFFRGGWCPYCSAELVRFNAMKSELASYGVNVVALSKDSVEHAAIHKTRDNLDITLLSDPDLNVIRQYGVEHHKALNFVTGTLTIGGLPFAFTPSFKAMAIPTTLLVDEKGDIQWIDQSEDYRLRSDSESVLAEVKKAFAKTADNAE